MAEPCGAPADELDDGLPSSSYEDAFNAAADYLGHMVSSNPAAVPRNQQLQLYGLYKQATAGDCRCSRPWFWQLAARSKW
jgi:acyl-CoA-binding protein